MNYDDLQAATAAQGTSTTEWGCRVGPDIFMFSSPLTPEARQAHEKLCRGTLVSRTRTEIITPWRPISDMG